MGKAKGKAKGKEPEAAEEVAAPERDHPAALKVTFSEETRQVKSGGEIKIQAKKVARIAGEGKFVVLRNAGNFYSAVDRAHADGWDGILTDQAQVDGHGVSKSNHVGFTAVELFDKKEDAWEFVEEHNPPKAGKR